VRLSFGVGVGTHSTMTLSIVFSLPLVVSEFLFDAGIGFFLIFPHGCHIFLNQISPEHHLVFMAECLCLLAMFLGDPG
jgi:hypothetical protein